MLFFFFKQKTAYEMCGRDWSSDVCSSDLRGGERGERDGEKEVGRENIQVTPISYSSTWGEIGGSEDH